MDNLINCSRCGSDACYVDEVNQDIKTYFCYGCGFQTNSLMKEGETFYEEQTNILPELYKDLFFKDGDEKIWMASSVNLPQQGMIFANGPSKEDWGWAAVKAVQVTEEEKEEYPLFRLVHYEVDFVLDKKEYKKILKTILNLYEQEEDYLKCVEIKNVIDKL